MMTDGHGEGAPVEAPVRVCVLGAFRVERNGLALPADAWGRNSARALVKILAIHPGHRLHRDQVLDLLWPNATRQSADAAFRKALHHARHALEPDLLPRRESHVLQVNSDLVHLVPDMVSVDADRFEQAAIRALDAVDPATVTHAADLYGGELLPEDRFEDWTTDRREALSDLWIQVLERLAEAATRDGRIVDAQVAWQKILDVDPAREAAHRGLMRLAASEGRRHDALHQYQSCRVAVAEALDSRPDDETEHLYQAILAGERELDPGGEVAGPPLPAVVDLLARGPLVGRDDAFATVMEALRRASRGHGGAIVLAGEAGIGKSRLAAEISRRAHERGWLTLWGAAHENEYQVPFGALVEALEPVIIKQDAAGRERLAARYPILADLLPSLLSSRADVGPPTSSSAFEEDRLRLYAALVALLDDIRDDRPVVLVLDDLHDADPSSLHLYATLARLSVERPWLVLVTFRPGDVRPGSEANRFLASFHRDRTGERLDLEPLDRNQTGRLVSWLLPDGAVPAHLVGTLSAEARGNPFFTQQMVQTMRSQEELALRNGQWVMVEGPRQALPREVRELITSRVARLGSSERHVLRLAAVAGASCSLQLLRDVGDIDGPELLDAIDRVVFANLLAEQGERYVFPHPMVRQAIHEELSQSRRAHLHAAIARAIEQRHADGAWPERVPGSIESLAYHWSAAAQPDRAVPYLVAAADHAIAVFANDTAIDRLQEALALIDGMPGGGEEPVPGRSALLERLGDVQALVGDSRNAFESYSGAIAHEVRDDVTIARLRRKCGQQAIVSGDTEVAEELVDAGDAGLETVDASREVVLERARLRAVRAQCAFLAFRFQDSLQAGEESLRLAEVAESPEDIGRACEMVAMASLPLGEWHRGLEFERRNEQLSDVDRAVRESSDIHLCLSEYNLYGDDPAASARGFLRSADVARRMGANRSVALAHYYLGNMSYFRGRFRRALHHLNHAIDLYRQLESASGEAIAVMMYGMTLTALGRIDEAHQRMEAGLDLAAVGTLRSHATIRMLAGLGRNRLDANDAAAARTYAERAIQLAEEPSDCICYAAVYPVATASFALTGDMERAFAAGDRALDQARAINSAPLICMAQQANAMALALVGEWEPAFVALDDARFQAETFDLPFERARTMLMRSFVHMQRHSARDLGVASALGAEAGVLLLRLGARASVAQARSSLGFLRSQ